MEGSAISAPNFSPPAWRALWRRVRESLAPRRGLYQCVHTRSLWQRLRRKPQATLVRGSWCCVDHCLESALAQDLREAPSCFPCDPAPRRIPLGLILLARQQLTAAQLEAAIAEQQAAGRGRIGEWLQELGFASEHQITVALARQYSCPVLRVESWPAATSPTPHIPATLFELFGMLPVAYVKETRTLHIAFAERVDYGLLYALDRMLACRTEPCLTSPSFLRQKLETLTRHRSEREACFDCVADLAEFSRIVRSYCTRLKATEIRLSRCGGYVWVRLFRASSCPVDLLLGLPIDATSGPRGTASEPLPPS